MNDSVFESFGSRNFGTVFVGDVRRTKRLVRVADQMARHPGGTLPDKLPNPAELRAFYRLMNCEEVTHEVLMRSHAHATRQAMAQSATLQPGVVLLILHDATELDYTSLNSLADQLGQIGQGTHRGYICHNSLVVQAGPQLILGLASQILHHRANVRKGETEKERRERENRESRLWVLGAAGCGPAPEGAMCVDISDSLSDTFEYMSYEVSTHRHFVLRARENRKLDESVAGFGYLLEAIRQQPAIAERQFTVQATAKQPARTANTSISYAAVRIAAPGKRSGDYEDCPLNLWAVRVWEAQPPQGVEGLEWILLTNVPVIDVATACERVAWYESRPIVEEFHKGMKTGCGIETLQFTAIERMEPAIALLSVLATTLLRIRDAARQPDADVRPATDVVDEEYVQVLADHYGSRLGRKPTVKKFYLFVARLGGHQNRKCDGMPGWLTLWRGWMKLQLMLVGHQLGRRANAINHEKCGKT